MNGPTDAPDSGSAYVVFGRSSPGTLDLAALGPAGIRIDGAAAAVWITLRNIAGHTRIFP